MRLADFIDANLEPLLADWERFARTIPIAREFDVARLRDHAEQMLRAIAADLRTGQTSAEQFAKSEGRGRRGADDTAAEEHGAARYAEGFGVNELLTEYRALRATVVRQWAAAGEPTGENMNDDLVRFNEAIDQALTEGLARFERDWKRDRDLLREEELRLQVAVDAADLGLWDLDLVTDTSSKRSLRHDQMFGYHEPPAQWSRAIAERHVLEEDRPVFRAAFERAKETGVLSFEARVRWPDGTVHWIAPRGRTRYDEAGRPVAMSGVVADVTEQHEFADRLRLFDRRKDEFLAVLAHELRNPLSPISTGLEILARHGRSRPDTLEQQLPRMQRQLGLLVRLVDDLLDVTRINRGTVTLQFETVSVPSILRQALDAAAPLIERKGHRLALRTPAERVLVRGDRARLVQVFSNLINNAAKYSDERAEISIDVHCEGDRAVVSVTDTGPGIAPELRSKVFEMFGRGPREGATQNEGLGIGLWLARQLVEQHGGTLELEDAAPHGCRFIVRLLRADAASDGAGAAGGSGAVAASATRRILVVDDNRDAADSLGEWLQTMGHEVTTAHDGATALEIARHDPPDVVLLDLGMSGLDGFEVARRLRTLPRGHTMVVVALTGWGQADDRQRTRDAGFDHHLVKPPDPTRLRTILDEGCRPPRTLAADPSV
jgi:signal transduction histidine kinase/ActR/RegA family two-component response regulator